MEGVADGNAVVPVWLQTGAGRVLVLEPALTDGYELVTRAEPGSFDAEMAAAAVAWDISYLVAVVGGVALAYVYCILPGVVAVEAEAYLPTGGEGMPAAASVDFAAGHQRTAYVVHAPDEEGGAGYYFVADEVAVGVYARIEIQC